MKIEEIIAQAIAQAEGTLRLVRETAVNVPYDTPAWYSLNQLEKDTNTHIANLNWTDNYIKDGEV